MNLLNGTILFQIICTDIVFSSLIPFLDSLYKLFFFFPLSFSPDSEEQPGFHEPADPAPGEGPGELPQEPGRARQVCGEDEHILLAPPTAALGTLILCSGICSSPKLGSSLFSCISSRAEKKHQWVWGM